MTLIYLRGYGMKPTAVFNNFRLQRCNVMMPVRCMVRRSGRWDVMGWRDLTVHDGTISPLRRSYKLTGKALYETYIVHVAFFN